MTKAFTLAEVLITLGIIGIVAALTMPNLIANYKKEEAISRLKKAYTSINQALKRSENDNGEYTNWSDTSISATEYINKYWLPYFNVAQICNTPQNCGYTSNKPYNFMDGTASTHTFSIDNLRIPFLTNDGIVYSFSVAGGNDALAENNIYIDINGAKKPNTWGKDVFIFVIVQGKGILPYGYNHDDNRINSECITGTGYSCAQKLISNGWKFSEDYPF